MPCQELSKYPSDRWIFLLTFHEIEDNRIRYNINRRNAQIFIVYPSHLCAPWEMENVHKTHRTNIIAEEPLKGKTRMEPADY